MNLDVNLFAKKIAKVRKKQKLKLLAFRGLLLLLLFLGLLMIGISGFSLMIAKSNQKIEADINKVKADIGSLSEVESKQIYLISKLDSFASLLETHEKHQGITETVFALIPNGTTLKGFQVSEDGIINLSGTVPDFTTLSKLLENIKTPNNYRLPITGAKVSKITFGKEGTVSFNIDLSVGVGQKKKG